MSDEECLHAHSTNGRSFIGNVIYLSANEKNHWFSALQAKKAVIQDDIFAVIMIAFLANAALHPATLLYAVPGTLIGVVFVVYAARYSTFQWRESQLFYRTHKWIEVIILILFLARFLYRSVFLASAAGAESLQDVQYGQHFIRDPLTVFVFFILGAYYIGFNAFVLRKGKGLKQEEAAVQSTF
ncbi:hypothetical protein [Fictibacillus terranigra]|uniref:Uncharacterized protein n=1 Tax=Fictibacillus terranigra TaxID=3058424 RepID=A0ABT8E7X5_9BACL|nr:hypothetical protein [Fictibacillus sp. CENA-BCM004]MDN4074002.1 hypothetical protein [Fictibacillus sp. CENA-BCM004]